MAERVQSAGGVEAAAWVLARSARAMGGVAAAMVATAATAVAMLVMEAALATRKVEVVESAVGGTGARSRSWAPELAAELLEVAAAGVAAPRGPEVAAPIGEDPVR